MATTSTPRTRLQRALFESALLAAERARRPPPLPSGPPMPAGLRGDRARWRAGQLDVRRPSPRRPLSVGLSVGARARLRRCKRRRPPRRPRRSRHPGLAPPTTTGLSVGRGRACGAAGRRRSGTATGGARRLRPTPPACPWALGAPAPGARGRRRGAPGGRAAPRPPPASALPRRLRPPADTAGLSGCPRPPGSSSSRPRRPS